MIDRIDREDDRTRSGKSTVLLSEAVRGRATSGAPQFGGLTISFTGGLCAERTSVTAVGDLVRIGRVEMCDILLDGETVSRIHCEIARVGSTWVLRDASRNGTFVNGEKVAQIQLHDGDQIRIGQNILTVSHSVARRTRDLGTRRTSANRVEPRLPMEPQIVVKGLEEGVTQPFSEERITVGRGADNNLVLDDDKVSRRHLEITRERDQYAIEDLGSVNGTLINGQRITRQALNDADQVRIGDYEVTVRMRDGDCILSFRRAARG